MVVVMVLFTIMVIFYSLKDANSKQNGETPKKINLANVRVVLRPDPLHPLNHYQRKILHPQVLRFGRAMKIEKGCLSQTGSNNNLANLGQDKKAKWGSL